MTLSERIAAAEVANYALEVEIADAIWQAKWGKRRPKDIRADAFTASIDAALTLVPEGALLSIDTYDGPGVYPEHVRASAWVRGAPRCFAATPALALAAAALKARGL